MQAQPLVRAACASCGAPLSGRYCSACGEAVLVPHDRTLRHFISSSLLDEVVHLDSKFWTTIRALLFKPGELTLAYINGRRRGFVGPVKLLLAAIFAFVVLTRGGFAAALFLGPVSLSIAPSAPPSGATVRQTVQFVDRLGVLTPQLDRKIGAGDGPAGAAQAQFQDRIRQFAQPLTFGNVFFIAAGLLMMFRARLPFYLDHLVFSVHAVTFVLLSSIVLAPAFWIDERRPSIALAMVLMVGAWQFGYLTTAIRRMYFRDAGNRVRARMRAFGVAIVVYLLNGVFVTAVQLFAGWYAIREL